MIVSLIINLSRIIGNPDVQILNAKVASLLTRIKLYQNEIDIGAIL